MRKNLQSLNKNGGKNLKDLIMKNLLTKWKLKKIRKITDTLDLLAP